MYRIKDWERHFENSNSKRVIRMEWVPIKNKHDGKGYRRLMAHPKAAEIFGAWTILVQVASKSDVRGVLADEDGSLDASDISDATGFPVKSILLALEVLSDKRIGWIIDDSKQTQTNVNVYEQPTVQYITLQKNTEEKNNTCEVPPAEDTYAGSGISFI